MSNSARLKKSIFWDFHGTLEVPDHKWVRLLERALRSEGYGIHTDELNQALLNAYTWNNYQRSYTSRTGTVWWDDLFISIFPFFERYGIDRKTGDAVLSLFQSEMLRVENYVLFDDAVGTLEQCQILGYKNYLLSNNFPELEMLVKQLPIAHFFDGYIVSACFGYEKPRIEIFEYAKSIAENPDICYMIGDNLVADIAGGSAAGMKTILVHKSVDSFSQKQEITPDHCVNTLSEIPETLV